MKKDRSAEELRDQAEKQLIKRKRNIKLPSTPVGLQRLNQELEVHQIELEMQNEELLQARSELERTLDQYTDLYDFAPVGYFTLSQSGVILNVNLTGTRMVRMARSKVVNQRFDRFIHVKNRTAFSSFLAKVCHSRNLECIELVLQIEGYREIYSHIEAIVSENNRECRLALVDITKQKKAEVELRESENKYRVLFETMSQGVVYQDPEGIIITVNPAAEKIFGMKTEQLQGKTPKDLNIVTMHEDGSDFPENLQPYSVALRTGEMVSNVVMGLYTAQTGKYTWLNMNAIPQFKPDADRPYQVIVTLEDISHIKLVVAYNKLTSREKQVFRLLVKGCGRQEISDILKVSPKTADKHKENLMHKLNFHTHDDIVNFAELIKLINN
jgi:PAS domain S-box-containing protein